MAQYREQDAFLGDAAALLRTVNESLITVRSIRDQVADLMARAADVDGAESVQEVGQALIDKIDAWEEQMAQTRQETFQDVINFPNKFNAQVIALLGSVDGTEPPVTRGARDRLADLQNEWVAHAVALEALAGADVDAFNSAVSGAGVPAVIIKR